jgi:hypothetical protein
MNLPFGQGHHIRTAFGDARRFPNNTASRSTGGSRAAGHDPVRQGAPVASAPLGVKTKGTTQTRTVAGPISAATPRTSQRYRWSQPSRSTNARGCLPEARQHQRTAARAHLMSVRAAGCDKVFVDRQLAPGQIDLSLPRRWSRRAREIIAHRPRRALIRNDGARAQVASFTLNGGRHSGRSGQASRTERTPAPSTRSRGGEEKFSKSA